MPRSRVLQTAPVLLLFAAVLPAALMGPWAVLSIGAPLVQQPARSKVRQDVISKARIVQSAAMSRQALKGGYAWRRVAPASRDAAASPCDVPKARKTSASSRLLMMDPQGSHPAISSGPLIPQPC